MEGCVMITVMYTHQALPLGLVLSWSQWCRRVKHFLWAWDYPDHSDVHASSTSCGPETILITVMYTHQALPPGLVLSSSQWHTRIEHFLWAWYCLDYSDRHASSTSPGPGTVVITVTDMHRAPPLGLVLSWLQWQTCIEHFPWAWHCHDYSDRHASSTSSGPESVYSTLPAFPPTSAPVIPSHTLKGKLNFPGHSEGMWLICLFLRII